MDVPYFGLERNLATGCPSNLENKPIRSDLVSDSANQICYLQRTQVHRIRSRFFPNMMYFSEN